ncbi:single-stranded DNA-binding protein [Microbacterium sp. gxy059]|uniref:single-stranded DNA-binding protein n=1 Tax=Microbacterium sp. gxy059 TaxID=2957199 RepID=UPI003D96B18A
MSDSITVIGNIAEHPMLMTSSTGSPYTRIRIASPSRRRDPRTGEWRDAAPNWYSVVLFRALAENAVSSLEKGQRVIVTGKLNVERWERDERSGTHVEILADGIGPDLRFGTARFARAVAQASAERPADDQAPSGAAAPQASDARAAAPPSEWAAPGEERATSETPEHSLEDAPVPY